MEEAAAQAEQVRRAARRPMGCLTAAEQSAALREPAWRPRTQRGAALSGQRKMSQLSRRS